MLLVLCSQGEAVATLGSFWMNPLIFGYRRPPMKALTYHGAKNLRLETVPAPVLSAVDDVILRVTGFCDLAMLFIVLRK